MPKPTTDDVNRQQLYSDAYFDTGHWGLKIRQTIVGIVGWIAVIVPITVTVLSIWSSYNPHIPRFWHYHEGLFEFKRERVVEQWPTFNPINQKKRQQLLAQFMADRFGNAEFREHTRHYRVKPEQNLDTNQIQQLYQQNNLDDIND